MTLYSPLPRNILLTVPAHPKGSVRVKLVAAALLALSPITAFANPVAVKYRDTPVDLINFNARTP